MTQKVQELNEAQELIRYLLKLGMLFSDIAKATRIELVEVKNMFVGNPYFVQDFAKLKKYVLARRAGYDPGKEKIPVYITCPYCEYTRDYQELCDADGNYSGDVVCKNCGEKFGVIISGNQVKSKYDYRRMKWQ